MDNSKYCKQHSQIVEKRFQKKHGHRKGGPITSNAYHLAPDISMNLRRHVGTKRVINPDFRRSTPNYNAQIGEVYLPVYRVANLYKPGNGWNANPNHCGRYFFIENDSDTFLNLGRDTRVFGSKVEAYVRLYQELVEKQNSKLIYKVGQKEIKCIDHNLLLHSYDTVPSLTNFMNQTASEEAKTMSENCQLWGFDAVPHLWEVVLGFEPLSKLVTQFNSSRKMKRELVPIYEAYFGRVFHDIPDEKEENDVGFEFLSQQILRSFGKPIEGQIKLPELSRLFPTINPNESPIKIGQLDGLDGPICIIGKNLGIDTIILSHEVGGHDAVSELIDLRDNAYDHLVHNIHVLHEDDDEDDNQFPKIWTPNCNGVVTVIDLSEDQVIAQVHKGEHITISSVDHRLQII
jgi:hypothetical protein